MVIALIVIGLGALALAQSVSGGFEGFWGPGYTSLTSAGTRSSATTQARLLAKAAPTDSRSRLVYWNSIAIDASGLDHTPVEPGEVRVFGEQIGPGRASRAMAIVHIAIADGVNAIAGRWESYADMLPAPNGASLDAAIAQAAHDALVAVYPSQADVFDTALTDDLKRIGPQGKQPGRMVGRRAAAAIVNARKDDGAQHIEPRIGDGFTPSNDPGSGGRIPSARFRWRSAPIGATSVRSRFHRAASSACLRPPRCPRRLTRRRTRK